MNSLKSTRLPTTLVSLLFLAACSTGVAHAKEKKGEDEKGASVSYEDIVADNEKSAGFLTAYHSPEHFYFELPEEMLGRDYCLSARLLGAVGDWRLRGTGLGSDVVRFEKLGEKVRLVKRNLHFRADPGTTIHYAVESTFPHSPILAAKVETTHPKTRALIADFKGLFSPSTYEILSNRSGFKAGDDQVTILSVHNNPENLTVLVEYHLSREPKSRDEGSGEGESDADGIGRLADSRNIALTVQYDLFALPANDFRPRPADPRLGVWSQPHKDYTRIENRDTAFRYNALRWHVEKSDPDIGVSPPVKPVTFYIDRSVPHWVRPLIREGAAWWNEAFEKVGVSGAVEVRDQPEDANWHPTDIRYSVIYWNVADNLNFSGAAGPSLVNPLTGQVLKANVYLNAEFLSFSRHRYLVYSWWRAPARQSERVLSTGPRSTSDDFLAERERSAARLAAQGLSGSRLCDYQASFSSQLAFARLVLQSRGQLTPGSPEEDRFAREAFVDLVAHEVGHALGFGHNFKASQLASYDDILSGAAGEAISGSVMDYNPINLSLEGAPKGPFFLMRLGAYDHLAVEYLYKPLGHLAPAEEHAELDRIAARAEEARGLAFDNGLLSGADPSSSTDDLGDDSLRFADDRLGMVAELLPQLPELVVEEGHNYNVIRQALDAAIVSVSMDYFDLAARHVGGQRVLRLQPRRGEEGVEERGQAEAAPPGPEHTTPAAQATPQPITPLPAATQRAALDLIERRLFHDDAFVVSPEFLNTLQADLQYDWNYPYRYGSDYSYESRLRWLYRNTLSTIFDADRLARVVDNEARYQTGDERFTLPELFDRLTDAVLRGLDSGNVSAGAGGVPLVATKRRALHRVYVEALSALVLSSDGGAQADASMLAAAELRDIRGRVRRAAGGSALDGYGRAHLADLEARIDRVLEASIELPAGS